MKRLIQSNPLTEKVLRRMSPWLSRQTISVNLERPVVSLTFDDCPKSVINNALPLIEKENWRATVYVACQMCDDTNHLGKLMSLSDVKSVHNAGHEIGDHTYSHLDAFEVMPKHYEADIDKNQAALAALGIPASRTFAYPYGQIHPAIKKRMEKRFEASRGITAITHTTHVDLNQVGSAQMYSGKDIDDVVERIENLGRTSGWLTLFSHDVSDSPSPYGCTPKDLRRVIKALKEIDAEVLPVADAIDKIRTRQAA